MATDLSDIESVLKDILTELEKLNKNLQWFNKDTFAGRINDKLDDIQTTLTKLEP